MKSVYKRAISASELVIPLPLLGRLMVDLNDLSGRYDRNALIDKRSPH